MIKLFMGAKGSLSYCVHLKKLADKTEIYPAGK